MRYKAKAAPNAEDAGSGFLNTLDLEGRVKRNPYGMVAGALGIGFVLGGGLFTRLAARILSTGLRIGFLAAVPLLEKELVEAVTRSKKLDIHEGERR